MELHQGPARLQFSEKLGRPIVCGGIETLSKPDYQRVKEALGELEGDELEQLLSYYHGSYNMMIGIGLEWVLTWHDFAAREMSPAKARAALKLALESSQKLTHEQVASLFSGELPAEPLKAYRQGEWGGELAQRLGSCFAEVQLANDKETSWTGYFELARAIHDGLFTLAWAYGDAVRRLGGDEMAARGVHESLVACSFYEMVWQNTKALSVVANVVALAEHLRAHFSGRERLGSVEVIEESDRYRIVLDCCGSGGAIRRRQASAGVQALGSLEGRYPVTWGRTDVPLLCAHCACNELESIERLGYPLFSTEFEPDPFKPCGWTLFKDPELIPEERFTRLEKKRDPSSFKRLPVSV